MRYSRQTQGKPRRNGRDDDQTRRRSRIEGEGLYEQKLHEHISEEWLRAKWNVGDLVCAYKSDTIRSDDYNYFYTDTIHQSYTELSKWLPTTTGK